VDAAIIAEELGRGVADTAFLGPTLAAELRRMGGAAPSVEAQAVILTPDLGGLAAAVAGRVVDGALAIDAAGCASALVLVPEADGHGLGEVRVHAGDAGVDLTRSTARVGPAVVARLPGTLTDEQVTRWTAFGLALACADLVGTMRGAITLTCDYAAARHQYGVPVGRLGRWARPRSRCTAASETRGTAWPTSTSDGPCSRATSSVAKGRAWPGCSPTAGLEARMDFGDSAEEAAFRGRLRQWVQANNPGLPASSTSDAYWAGQAAWHQALYDAGFFGLSWPTEIGGRGLPTVYEVIVDEELASAGAPPRPSLGYLVQGILQHGNDDIQGRFLPGLVSGRDRWCQGFSEPDAGSDLASLRTRAERSGDDYVITGHKVWTSYSDDADWCLALARTDPDVPKHRGLSAFAVPMGQTGITQRPLRMINGITKEFGEVIFDSARVPAANMIGAPGEGWALAMTVVSHEREPGELGYVARYTKLVNQLTETVRAAPDRYGPAQRQDLGWAIVEAEMLRLHVCRRLSDRLDGISHGPEGSVDKLLMTAVEQAVGHAGLSIGGAGHGADGDTWLKVYLYSRAQSVMGGTSQIQRNLVARRILGLPAS
jgi:alkylation response protein AidB-like acyl-CoA dehydrogenase